MRWLAAALTATLLFTIGPPVEAAEDPRVGVLIVDHGEPPEYNERTYESFREFFNHLIEMGLIPAWLKLLETGTITVDTAALSAMSPRPSPNSWTLGCGLTTARECLFLRATSSASPSQSNDSGTRHGPPSGEALATQTSMSWASRCSVSRRRSARERGRGFVCEPSLSSPLSSRVARSSPLRRGSTPSMRRRWATWHLGRGSPSR